ncbi:conserved hypothetical protein [Burkholderia pseudomallei MSHR346]|nr:conserved hypothetical protein [Burkholderia pseudomallei MSHR346]
MRRFFSCAARGFAGDENGVTMLADTGHRTPDTGHRTPDTGHRTSDIGHRALQAASRESMKHDAKCELHESGLRSAISDRATQRRHETPHPAFRFRIVAPHASTRFRRRRRPMSKDRSYAAAGASPRVLRVTAVPSRMTLTSVKSRPIRASRAAARVCARCRSGMLGRGIYRPERISCPGESS